MPKLKKHAKEDDCYAKLMDSAGKDPYAVFRHNLAVLRTAHEMTQEDLADAAGVSRMAIAKWETGRGMPKLDNLIILRQIFGVTVDDMLFSELSPNGKDETKK